MKRFTETLKWSDPWFRKLKPEEKLLWWWLCDNCDHAGIIEPDIELAAFQIGYAMGIATLSELGERIVKLPNGKFFLPKFIEFQYGDLSTDCKAHNPVFASILKNNIQEFVKGMGKGIDTLKDKDKDKDKEKDITGKFTKPTIEAVQYQAGEYGLSLVEADKFFNYYSSNGWRVGRNPMKSWTHALINWKKNVDSRIYENGSNHQPQKPPSLWAQKAAKV